MKSFTINKHKYLEDLCLDNLRKINLIIGENNIGKSAVLEALAMCVSAMRIQSIQSIQAVHYVYPSTYNANKRLAPPYKPNEASRIPRYDNEELSDNTTRTNFEKPIIEVLRLIDPRIEKIGMLEGDKGPYVILRNDLKKHSAFSMGTGINRILRIGFSLRNAKEGVLLIDEFENGLHYSIQASLWKMIDELAEKLDVQVFATTHSLDCIRGFAKSIKKDLGLIIRLQKKAKGIVPVYFEDPEEVLFALDNGIDIR